MKVYDAHMHILTDGYHEFLKKHNASLEDGLYLPNWKEDDMLQFMDESKIDYALLSVSSPQPYFYDDDKESVKICRELNETMASLKRKYPDRIGFQAILPLPNVEKAIEEAIYCLDELHANGIKLASNSRGMYLGNPLLDPLYEELNKRHAIINIHPHKPYPMNTDTFASKTIPLFEFFCDTTRSVLDLIGNDILSKYPNIKIIVPHCGAFLPNIADRASGFLPILVKMGMIDKDIHLKENLSKLYYDVAGNPVPDLLPLLMKITSSNHILYGSDYPFTPSNACKNGLNTLIEFLKDDQELLEDILYKNFTELYTAK